MNQSHFIVRALCAITMATCVTAFSACGGGGDGGGVSTPPPSQTTERTTVLVYSIVSTLGYGTDDLLTELRALKGASNFNVVVQTGGAVTGSSYRSNTRFSINAGGQPVAMPVDSNTIMSTTASLRDFIAASKAAFPAERYHLFLVDHGGFGYFGQDERDPGKSLRPADIAAAVTGAGVRLGIIGLDACLLATATAAKDFQPIADYLVASEEIGWSGGKSGWDFGKLATLKSSPTAYESAAIAIADGYMARNIGRQKTASVIKLSQIGAWLTAYGGLAQRLSGLLTVDAAGNEVKKRIANARKQSYSFGSFAEDYFVYDVDAKYFLARLKAQNVGTATNAAIDTAVTALNDAIVYSKQTLTPSANGLSIVLPSFTNASRIDAITSGSLSMVTDTSASTLIDRYRVVLKAYQGAIGGLETTSIVVSGAGGCTVGTTCKPTAVQSFAVNGKVSGVATKPDEVQSAVAIAGPGDDSALVVQTLGVDAAGQYAYTWDHVVFTLNGIETVAFLAPPDETGTRIGRMPIAVNGESWVILFADTAATQTLLSMLRLPTDGSPLGGQMTVETALGGTSATITRSIGLVAADGSVTTTRLADAFTASALTVARKSTNALTFLRTSRLSHAGDREATAPLRVP